MIRPRPSLFLASLLAACGAEPSGPAQRPASPEVQKLVLAADPGASLGVLDAKLEGPADRVVVEGRIREITAGFAQFKLMDVSVPYCGETNREDDCKTPWDYCCEADKKIVANSIVVEVRGADGSPVATPSLPDLRLLDRVKVTGRLERDEHRNDVLVATGLFRVERPALHAGVQWPQ